MQTEIGLNWTTKINYNEIKDEIAKIQLAFGNQGKKTVLKWTGTRFLEMSKSTFGASGKAEWRGNIWPKYSKSYAKKVGSYTPTLYRSGKLKNSIRMGSPRGNWIEVYSQGTAYSGAQFFGTSRIPARRFFPTENKGASSWRLTFKAQRDLNQVISKGLRILSRGALPYIAMPQGYATYSNGNPRTGPS